MKIPCITPAHNGKSWKNTAAVGSERRIPCYIQQSDICTWIHLKFTTWSERFFHFEASILEVSLKSPFSHLAIQPSWNIFYFFDSIKLETLVMEAELITSSANKELKFLDKNECVWTPNRYRCAHDAISREKICCWKFRHQRSWSTLTVQKILYVAPSLILFVSNQMEKFLIHSSKRVHLPAYKLPADFHAQQREILLKVGFPLSHSPDIRRILFSLDGIYIDDELWAIYFFNIEILRVKLNRPALRSAVWEVRTILIHIFSCRHILWAWFMIIRRRRRENNMNYSSTWTFMI